MKGFKDTTKTKYGAHGSACFARGGAVKKAVAAFKKADAVQDAKLVAKAVKSVTKMAEGGEVYRRDTEYDKDFADTKRSTDYLYGPVRKDGSQLEVRVGPKPTKTEAMAYVDAERRIRKRGDNVGMPREMAEIGFPAEREGKKLKDKMPDLATSKAAGYKPSARYAKGGKVRGGLAFCSKPMIGK